MSDRQFSCGSRKLFDGNMLHRVVSSLKLGHIHNHATVWVHTSPRLDSCPINSSAFHHIVSGRKLAQKAFLGVRLVTLCQRFSFGPEDWFAIPQITARVGGVNEDLQRSDAAKAVQSIPGYVEVRCMAWPVEGWAPGIRGRCTVSMTEQ